VIPELFGPILNFPSVEELVAIPSGSRLRVKEQSADVWSFALEAHPTVLGRFHTWLSDEERARSARFIHRDDQIRYTLAHGGLRAVLAHYLGLEPAVLRFRAGPTGKPALLDRQECPHGLRFNLSHSHGRMMLTVSDGQEVGIDLEQMRDEVEALKLAERFYAAGEYEQVLNRSGADQVTQFYRYWVAKEAVLKGQGVGLQSLQQCEILPESMARSTVRLPADSRMQSGWTVRWLNCGAGWQGAVAAHGDDWSVRVMNASCA
jgi:4'-phosphopantetheinyl transferase